MLILLGVVMAVGVIVVVVSFLSLGKSTPHKEVVQSTNEEAVKKVPIEDETATEQPEREHLEAKEFLEPSPEQGEERKESPPQEPGDTDQPRKDEA